MLGFDLPRPQRGRRHGRVGRADNVVISNRNRGGLADRLIRLLRRCRDQSVEAPPFRICRLQRADHRRDQRPWAEVDRDDETDHKPGHQQRPRPPYPGQADHQAVDRPSRRTAGLSSQSKEPDQRDHRHRGRQCVEQPRSRRLRPQHVRPERDYRHDRNEQRAAEGRDHPLLQPGKNRPGVACHRQEREQAGEDQQYAYDLADLALREMRTARSFGARGSRSRGRGATGASRV